MRRCSCHQPPYRRIGLPSITLDLNRNGRFDTNGPGVWLDSFGNVIENNHPFLGDPEWIGILDKPDQRHSGSNYFVARYAYIALPIGNSEDINYIHNQAKAINPKAEGTIATRASALGK